MSSQPLLSGRWIAAFINPSVPLAVTNLACSPNGADVDLTWTAPDDGGSPITDYLVYVGEAQTF